LKTRKEFFEDFFARLTQRGFRVESIMESDIAAEVYNESSLFCVVTQDGELVFETYGGETVRALEQAAEETRTGLSCCMQPPFADRRLLHQGV
jgi:glucosamine 6-phosphate synthetase-like amidotransferase/phosphosugar isomerase protein